MKIFVAYGYNPRDSWIPELVFPIIVDGFNSTVVTGEQTYTGTIPGVVLTNITESDALIAFTTRRNQFADGSWSTHDWVKQEFAVALGQGKFVLEVRESNVDPQGGIGFDRQYIPYDENERDKCLVKLVSAIGLWNRQTAVNLQLMPEGFVEEIRPLLRDQDLRCTYKTYINNRESEDIPARIRRIKGGLFIDAPSIPRGALIQVHIEYRGRSWTSDFESIESISINLLQG
jgi:hypothetical protein